MDEAWEAAEDIIERHNINDPDNSIFNDILEAIRSAEDRAKGVVVVPAKFDPNL